MTILAELLWVGLMLIILSYYFRIDYKLLLINIGWYISLFLACYEINRNSKS